MRLAVVSQQGCKAAGAEHALLQFVERLPPVVEVVWFFFEDGEFAETIRRRFAHVTIVAMSQRVASAQRAGLPLNAVVDSVSVAWRLARALAVARPDVVLTNSMKAHIIGSLGAKLARLPCVNYIHDIVDGSALGLLRVVSRLCASERLTCSQRVKDNVRLPKTTVVHAAIDVATFAHLPAKAEARAALGLPAGQVPVVGLVGRIARWKGQDAFIRIASEVRAEHSAHFCIVGSPIFGCDHDYVNTLEAAVAQRGLRADVTFVPWQNDMRRVYAALDVAVNCSRREPFGRTTLEALASGVPIVCFDDAGICEIFEQDRGGTRVPAGDEVAFAAAIGNYLTGSRAAAARRDARQAARRIDIRIAYATFARALARVGGGKFAHSDVSVVLADDLDTRRLAERKTNECLLT